MKITAAIIACNESSNIRRALRSVGWADEILVVDSGSTDDTTSIAETAGARVIENAWPGFSDQKQFATDSASNDWILSLDADECVSPELAKEIKDLDPVVSNIKGFRIPRLSSYMGREIRHGGWYPDWQLRLFDRRAGKWNGKIVHESFALSDGAQPAKLSSPILHNTLANAIEHHQMIGERYAPLAAAELQRLGRTTSPLKVFYSAPAAFFRTYLLKAGFRDGVPGLSIAMFAAHHAFLKNLMLWELQNGRDRSGMTTKPTE